MKALIVYCHPVEGSFCSALRDAARRGLERAGHDVSVIDLAAESFDPVMRHEEWDVYMSHAGTVPEALTKHAAVLSEAEIMVFVYPTWWSGVPAQLKGWFERVLVPGVGFRLDERQRVRPGIANARHLHAVTTYGSPKTYVRLVNDNGRRLIGRALRLAMVHRPKLVHHGLYRMDKATDDDRRAFLNRIEARMSRL